MRLARVGACEETTETRAVSVAVGLSAIPSELTGLAVTANWRGQSGKVWLALLNETGGMLRDPIQVYSGRMDVMSWSDGDQNTITLTIESRLADLDRARVRRYTDRDQQNEYPSDLGF